jgi:hypothetical protein
MGRMIEPKKCSVCKVGLLIPAGNDLGQFRCDNPECRMYLQNKNVDKNMFETVKFGDSASAKVTTRAEFEARKRERRCSSCDEKKDIVFEKGDARLCKDCLDNFRIKYGV